MARPINQLLRQARTEEILQAARAQLAAEGLAGFSLRAVARRLELAPNAIYNYFPSLDDLITALLVDAFQRFGDAIQAADHPNDVNCSRRFEQVCIAYRRWVIANPVDYDLIFGQPIPGYDAPEKITGPLAVRGFSVGLQVLTDAWRSEQLQIPTRYHAIPVTIQTKLAEHMDPAHPEIPLTIRYLMQMTWSRLHGMITLEIHGNLQHALGDPEAFFRHGVACLIEEIGLGHNPPDTSS